MGGWIGGGKSRFKDSLQQSKRLIGKLCACIVVYSKLGQMVGWSNVAPSIHPCTNRFVCVCVYVVVQDLRIVQSNLVVINSHGGTILIQICLRRNHKASAIYLICQDMCFDSPNWMETLAGSDPKSVGDHLNIEMLQLLFIMPV